MGVRWQIMSGNEVRFWVDNWVPCIPAGHLTSPLNNVVSQVVHVVEFIDLVLQRWNLHRVSDLIPVEERNAIINIYVGALQRSDKLMWHSTKNGD